MVADGAVERSGGTASLARLLRRNGSSLTTSLPFVSLFLFHPSKIGNSERKEPINNFKKAKNSSKIRRILFHFNFIAGDFLIGCRLTILKIPHVDGGVVDGHLEEKL